MLQGPWWERITRGPLRVGMPGGDRTGPVPIPLQLGIPLNEYLEDLTIWSSARLAKYEDLVGYGAGRLVLEHGTLALARTLTFDGPVTNAMQAELVDLLAGAVRGMRPDMDELLRVSMGHTLEHQAYVAGEFQDVWAQYRSTLAGLPPWQVPPVGGFALAVNASDPAWPLRGLVEDIEDAAVLAMRRQVLGSYLRGESVPQLASRLRSSWKAAGHDYQRVARTSLHRMGRAYQQETYRQNSEVLSKERYVATLDSRTCPVCGMYDGKAYALGAGPVVPVHDSCRCTYMPVTKSIRELLGMPPADETPEQNQARASMDGRVPASTLWPDWLDRKEKQTPGFARGILGATKYDAWVAGELKLGDVVRGGRERTLAQLGLTR